MAEFVLELYVSRAAPSEVDRFTELARRGADELTSAGTPVRHVQTMFIAEDETCFLVFEADSADAVREAAALVDLPSAHVAESFTRSPG